MNKGLAIRNRKLEKNFNKMNTITKEQEDTCQYVKIRYNIIKKINGKYRHIGIKEGYGLQVKNRVYLVDGSYKMVNNRETKVTRVFDDTPEWATDDMKTMYAKKKL